jgi:hypothetical protein
MKISFVGRSITFALAWQCCQGMKMEEGSEEQFQAETLTLAQCSSAVKKVQETGKYTEEAIMPICSSVVRSSKCDFFSEALSLATSHTDFNGKVFCKNIGEAHFCSQTMDRLLTSPVMSDLAFGACMRDKSSRGAQYCQRFSKMHAYAVQHDDLDTMRACYMMEAYDDSDRDDSNSKKSDHEESSSKKPEHEESGSKKPAANSTNGTNHTSAPVAKPHANVTAAVVIKKVAQKAASAKSDTVGKVTTQHATIQSHDQKKVHAKASHDNGTSKNSTVEKDTTAKKDASAKNTPAKKAEHASTSLVSSLIHTLSATVAGVAHVVAKVLPVPPSPHDAPVKQQNGSASKAPPATKKPATEAPVAPTSKGASLTQAQKVSVKQKHHVKGKDVKVKAAKAAVSIKHPVASKPAAASRSVKVTQSAHSAKANGIPHVKQHQAALMNKHTASQKIETNKKGNVAVSKDGKKHGKETKDEKGKYGGFLSGFISL